MSQEISIRVRTDDPAFLEGLDRWLQLGLISDPYVRQLARQHLSCVLPPPLPKPQPVPESVRREFASETPALVVATKPASPAKPPLPTAPQLWQALRENFSILWLLAAGTFIIVAASTGLAITQWQNLPAVLQYGLLWAYTLGFAGASLWTARQEHLVLTARSLQILAGLLVPVNFWAMHSFGLWRFGLFGWLAIAIGTVTLAGWVFLVRLPRPELYLGISAVQLLWSQPVLVAWLLQGGVASLAIARVCGQRLPTLWTFYGLGLALLRGLATATLPLANIGLAWGAWGWLLGRSRPFSEPASTPAEAESSSSSEPNPLVAVGDALAGGFLLWGAIATWQSQPPWQATLLVGLGLELCWRRLWRSRRSPRFSDTLALFGTGAVGYALVWQWLPPAGQGAIRELLARGLELPERTWFFDVLAVLAVFPYAFSFLGGLHWLQRSRQLPERLLGWGEAIALAAAGLGTLASFWFPGPRSLGLLCCCGLLAWVGGRRRNRVWLAVARGTGLLALGSGLAWKFDPPIQGWLVICLGLALLEWIAGARGDRLSRNRVLLRMVLRQGWIFGGILAGIGSILLWSPAIRNTAWGLLGAILPLGLAILAEGARLGRRRQLAAVSTPLLGAAVLPVWGTPAYRLAGLAIAALAMLLNTRNLPQFWLAATHIGYVLAYAVACLALQLQGYQWFLAAATALAGLQWGGPLLSRLYARASAGWAIAFRLGLGLSLSVHVLLYYFGAVLWDSLQGNTWLLRPIAAWQLLVSAGVLLLAAISRYRRSPQPSGVAIARLGWAVELVLAEVMVAAGGSLEILAVGNLLAAWGALLGPWWRRRKDGEGPAASFGMLAFLLHWGDFSALSGPITFGAALLGVVLGVRWGVRTLTYLSLGGLSLAIAETLVYWLQANGSDVLEFFWAFAIATTAIAIIYEAIAPFWPERLKLDRSALRQAAKFHGLAGGALLGWALALGTLSRRWRSPWGIGLGATLAGWAFWRGRAEAKAGGWIYLGCGQLVATGIYARLTLPKSLDFLDGWWVALVGLLAWGALLLPWVRLGWPQARPWERSALGLTVFGAFLHLLQPPSAHGGLELLELAALLLVLGARWRTRSLAYGALALVSWAIGELLWFWLPGKSNLDLILTWATAATAIAAIYELLAAYWPTISPTESTPKTLARFLTRAELALAAALHWGLANIALAIAAIATWDRPAALSPWCLGLLLVLAVWAIARGRRVPAWIYGGTGELLAAIIWMRLLVPALQPFDPWWALLACLVALALHSIPWQRWGWRDRQPWHRVAISLPAAIVAPSLTVISTWSLLAVAAYYAWLAWQERRWRQSYSSLPFLLWGLWQELMRRDWLDPLAIAVLVGGTILYVAQVDPGLRHAGRRHWRHWLRCSGSFGICATAAIAYGNPGFAPIVVGLGFGLVGLTLRVRAFLLAGTLTLIWTAGNSAFSLSQQYAFARWLIGLAVGLALVGLAAVFEGQRGRRLTERLRAWWQDLERWE